MKVIGLLLREVCFLFDLYNDFLILEGKFFFLFGLLSFFKIIFCLLYWDNKLSVIEKKKMKKYLLRRCFI